MLSGMHRSPCPRDAAKRCHTLWLPQITNLRKKVVVEGWWLAKMGITYAWLPLALEMVEKKVECVGGSREGGGFKT